MNGGVSVTTPEPFSDIRAQVGAVLNPQHPKDAVFIARGNAHVVARADGVLITTNQAKAEAFRNAAPLTDDTLASLLGYPETKAEVIASGDGVVVQAVDSGGCVITEAAASRARCAETMKALKDHGILRIVSPLDAQARRARES